MTELKRICWWVALLEVLVSLLTLIFSIWLIGIATGLVWLGPLGTPFAVLLISPLLWRRGESWAALGLRRVDSLPRLLAQTVVVAAVALIVLVTMSELLSQFISTSPASFLDRVRGNIWLYLYFLVVVAPVSQGLGEELLFRGFIQTRFRQMLGEGRAAKAAAIILQAALFGLLHSYQGPIGMIATGCVGAFFGFARVLLKGALWPLVLAHATCGAILISWEYFG